eukprot:CAMPEP_0176388952 /NCGR_PEP_ID=MMETSP0126-20121128/37984_1 /TAXON_ID=141414 ORGANISM="Strombidinopsis acuminatum, Strain SPMC142" /NCGR_SAMPLE_ID=MMETSP0126 /ASSEMBLY_ACC=CAM_ASM_000229 /LENGTH=46 /DNA_ID= /DNA_START= /DNA_END= /DNA_ORIENTATION=
MAMKNKKLMLDEIKEESVSGSNEIESEQMEAPRLLGEPIQKVDDYD